MRTHTSVGNIFITVVHRPHESFHGGRDNGGDASFPWEYQREPPLREFIYFGSEKY